MMTRLTPDLRGDRVAGAAGNREVRRVGAVDGAANRDQMRRVVGDSRIYRRRLGTRWCRIGSVAGASELRYADLAIIISIQDARRIPGAVRKRVGSDDRPCRLRLACELELTRLQRSQSATAGAAGLDEVRRNKAREKVDRVVVKFVGYRNCLRGAGGADANRAEV
jgi:hypothetical protein